MPSGNYVAVWSGDPPKTCQLCGCGLKDHFVDGRTRRGPWACMCLTCHRSESGKLGMGYGQKYSRKVAPETGKVFWQKVEG